MNNGLLACMHDDITWCDDNDCPIIGCFRNPKNMMDKTGWHSYAHFRDCDECQIWRMENDAAQNREGMIQ